MLAQTLTITSLAVAALAQSSSTSATITSAASAANAETTITALFGTATSGFVGSIIGANACETTMALVCDGDDTTPNDVCAQVPDVTATVVVGPSAYDFEFATSTLGAVVTLKNDCSLKGPSGSFTEATCTASVYGSVAGTSTSSSYVTTVTDSSFFQYAEIPITAGATKLPSGGATCDAAAQSSVDAAQSSSRTSSSGSAAGPTAMAQLYKVLVPVGAAVVAGAGAMI